VDAEKFAASQLIESHVVARQLEPHLQDTQIGKGQSGGVGAYFRLTSLPMPAS
jgi:hypothetical protein